MRPIGTTAVLVLLLAGIAVLAWACYGLGERPANPVALPPPPAPVQFAPSLPASPAPPVHDIPVNGPHPGSLTLLPKTPPAHPPLVAGDVAQPGVPVPPGEVVWKTLYEQHFDAKESLNDFLQKDGGELVWHEKHQALYLKNDEGGGQIYAALHRSLPGDLRVRMRVLRTKHSEEINIGVLFNIRGSLKGEDGYFAEWKMGEVQLKRNDQWKNSEAAATPATDDRWVTVELTKVGGQITMKMQGREVLAFTDPAPYRSSDHDLLSLYVWDERTLIDDLIVDRNANDPVPAMPDDPAETRNAIDGMRTTNDPNPDQF